MTPLLNTKQSLGKTGELLVISLLLDEGREVYTPVVDDHGIDLLVRTRNYRPEGCKEEAGSYEFQEIQVKTVSGAGEALFVFKLKQARPNYWFIFYVKNINTYWIINSMEIGKPGLFPQNKAGKHIGKYNICLTTPKGNISERNKGFIVKDLSKIP